MLTNDRLRLLLIHDESYRIDHHAISWLPPEYETQFATHLPTQTPQQPQAIVLVGHDPTWVRSIVAAVHGSGLRFLPILVAYDPKNIEHLHKLALSGADALLSSHDSAVVNAVRILLQIAESTKRHEADQSFKRQLSELTKAEVSLKQREEFLSICAHDLRDPLGVIRTCLKMLSTSADNYNQLSPTQEELVERSLRQADHALGLVRDLLDVTSFEQGLTPKYELVDLDNTLRELCIDWEFQSEQKQVALHYRNQVPDWRALVDIDRVRQLLQNLFTNALKFTGANKSIYIDVAPFKGRRKADPNYPMIVVNVRDEGQGISKDSIKRIFDKFSQVKSHARADGRGLGLTVAKQISTLHDGNLWVQSEPGKGSTFSVLLPHVVSRAGASPNRSSTKTILIAEPSAAVQEELFAPLRSWGYKTVFAINGVEAITLLFHIWPDALVVRSELTKLSIVEMIEIIKHDELARLVPIIGCQPINASTPCDATVSAPLVRSQWEALLKTNKR